MLYFKPSQHGVAINLRNTVEKIEKILTFDTPLTGNVLVMAFALATTVTFSPRVRMTGYPEKHVERSYAPGVAAIVEQRVVAIVETFDRKAGWIKAGDVRFKLSHLRPNSKYREVKLHIEGATSPHQRTRYGAALGLIGGVKASPNELIAGIEARLHQQLKVLVKA